MLGQIQDRIADDLPGAMIGDVAAAVAGMEFHVHLSKQAVSGAQMLALAVSAERDHVGMLAEKQHVGNRLRLARLDEPPLQLASAGVGNQPKSTTQQVLPLCSTMLLSARNRDPIPCGVPRS